MIKLIKSVYKLNEKKTYNIGEEVDFGKETFRPRLCRGD
jgi:hypothetical protein